MSGKRIPLGSALAGLVAALLVATNPAAAISFSGFSTTNGLALNGSATGNVNNGTDAQPVLRLVPAAIGDMAGSAFTSSRSPTVGFRTSFAFRLSDAAGGPDAAGQEGGDGLVFAIQPVGPGALGFTGAGLGFAGITPSLGIEFDSWFNLSNPTDPDSNHLGLDVNGDLNSVQTVSLADRFDDGNLWYAWVDYLSGELSVYAGQSDVRPAAPLLSILVDIPGILGADEAYFGFTAGKAAAFANHDIVAWQLSAVPEPLTMIALAAGVGAVATYLRRRTA